MIPSFPNNIPTQNVKVFTSGGKELDIISFSYEEQVYTKYSPLNVSLSITFKPISIELTEEIFLINTKEFSIVYGYVKEISFPENGEMAIYLNVRSKDTFMNMKNLLFMYPVVKKFLRKDKINTILASLE
jgi:hypothetical protein